MSRDQGTGKAGGTVKVRTGVQGSCGSDRVSLAPWGDHMRSTHGRAPHRIRGDTGWDLLLCLQNLGRPGGGPAGWIACGRGMYRLRHRSVLLARAQCTVRPPQMPQAGRRRMTCGVSGARGQSKRVEKTRSPEPRGTMATTAGGGNGGGATLLFVFATRTRARKNIPTRGASFGKGVALIKAAPGPEVGHGG
jgi:hypothetical protein